MKNSFDRLISRLDMAEERISELENISIEPMKTKKTKRTKIRGRKKPEQTLHLSQKLIQNGSDT